MPEEETVAIIPTSVPNGITALLGEKTLKSKFLNFLQLQRMNRFLEILLRLAAVELTLK
jgi:hypothetical protein